MRVLVCIHICVPQAVSSFTELLKLMGPKYITPCRVNVMALLRLVYTFGIVYSFLVLLFAFLIRRSSRKFKDEEICRLTCLAWGSFVKWYVSHIM